MKKLHACVYDAEIVHCVPQHGEERESDLTYCGGWGDKAGMGVAVVCAIDLWTGRSHIFLEDNLADFQRLAASRHSLVGFNSLSFDDGLLAAAGYPVTTTYDLKRELSNVLPGGQRVKGRTLDDYCRVNLPAAGGKSMHGGDAPKHWQRNKRGTVINYCMKDVWLTASLLCLLPGPIIDPATGQTVKVTVPFELQEPQMEIFLPNEGLVGV